MARQNVRLKRKPRPGLTGLAGFSSLHHSTAWERRAACIRADLKGESQTSESPPSHALTKPRPGNAYLAGAKLVAMLRPLGALLFRPNVRHESNKT
jgi:hypothetical protein